MDFVYKLFMHNLIIDDYLYDPVPVKPRVGHEVLDRTLRSGNQGPLADWLKDASPAEQQTVLKMLKQAEDSQIKQVSNSNSLLVCI